jgi:hypothetical protein
MEQFVPHTDFIYSLVGQCARGIFPADGVPFRNRRKATLDTPVRNTNLLSRTANMRLSAHFTDFADGSFAPTTQKPSSVE